MMMMMMMNGNVGFGTGSVGHWWMTVGKVTVVHEVRQSGTTETPALSGVGGVGGADQRRV